MSSTTIFAVVAVGIAGLSSVFAGVLMLANSSFATAPATYAPGAPPAGGAAQTGDSPPAEASGSAPQDNPFAPAKTSQDKPASGGSAPQTNPFVSPGTDAAVSTPSQPVPIKKTATKKPARAKVQFQKPRTAKPRKPSPKTTAPAPAAVKTSTRQQCRDAVYNWVNGEVYPRVDTNVGYSTDTVWYDAYDSAGVRAACGGCVKKDEYGITVGKSVGVKRYNDQWDDTKRSKLREESTRGWIADFITEKMPGTC